MYVAVVLRFQLVLPRMLVAPYLLVSALPVLAHQLLLRFFGGDTASRKVRQNLMAGAAPCWIALFVVRSKAHSVSTLPSRALTVG